MTKYIVLALATFSLFISTPIETQAQTTNIKSYVVNALSGLNVRNKDCKIISTVKFGSSVYSASDDKTLKPNINCNIAGKDIKMLLVTYKSMSTDVGYVATQFISPVLGEPFSVESVKVNTAGGLNLRDQNCKKVGFVANNTPLKVNIYTDNFPICLVNGTYYQMQNVFVNNKDYFVAVTFLAK